MVKYTTYIPEEMFFGRMSVVHILIVLAIILAIVAFFSYGFYRVLSMKRKPEYF